MGTEMEHVQVRYLFAIGAVEDDWDVTEEQAGDRFDRWLSAHDREVAAKVLRDAAASIGDRPVGSSAGHWLLNRADRIERNA